MDADNQTTEHDKDTPLHWQRKPETNEVPPLFGHPQSPGWYWTRRVAFPGAVTIQWVGWSDRERCFMVADGAGKMFPIDMLPDHDWYGPLTPPQWSNRP